LEAAGFAVVLAGVFLGVVLLAALGAAFFVAGATISLSLDSVRYGTNL